MDKLLIKKNSGQTLIEIALSIAVFVLVITALSVLATSSLKGAQEVVRKSESTKFANAGVEAALFYKNAFGFGSGILDFTNIDSLCYLIELSPTQDSSVLTLVDSSVTPTNDCVDTEGWVNVTSPYTNLVYERKINILNTAPNTYEVLSEVRWQDTQGTRNTFVKRILTDTR